MTPAPPDAPPPGAVCGDGVASVDALYACAAGGRLSGASLCGDSEEADQGVAGAAPRARRVERVGGTSGGVMPRPGRRRAEGPAARVSAGRACPCRRRRAARRASHAPHGRLSACRFGTIRQPVIVVCVFAMRRSSDIGRVPYIAMVASIRRVASIGRVASRLGESVPSVAEGVRPPRRAGRAGRDTLRLPSVWRAWCAACRFGTIRQPIIVVCVFAMRRSSRHRDRYLHRDRYIRHIRLDRCIRYIRLDRYIRRESGVSAGRVCRGGDPPAARRPVAARVSLGGEWSPAPRRRRGGRRAPAPLEPPLNSRLTAAPIMPYNSSYNA